ncbi:MAG: AbrB/MazE/SpoVT family DNA-binding domain-containing protein [Candidatus Caldarchaeales archaeon]
MRRGIGLALVGMLAVALALSLNPAEASNFISSVHDDRLTVTLTYPAEVKRGTCFQVRVEAFAHEPLSKLNLTVRLELRSGATVIGLLSAPVVTLWSGSPGPVVNTHVGACVATSHPTGVIVSKVEFEYLHSGSEFNLTNLFQMAFVRDRTYEELAALLGSATSEVDSLRNALNEAMRTIGSLTEEVRRLRSELERSRAEVAALQREKSELENRLNALNALYEGLRREYESLRMNHERLLRDHAALQNAEASLRRSYEELVKAHRDLQGDFATLQEAYAKLREEHSTLRALHEDLRTRHERLGAAYEESVRTAGSLRGALEEKARQVDVLTAMLEGALRERAIFSNIVIGQALGLGGLGALYLLERRRVKRGASGQASATGNGAATPLPPENGNGNGDSESLIQRVISGRRITIPKPIAERLGIKVGDLVELSLANGHVSVRPISQAPQLKQQPEAADQQQRQSSGHQPEGAKGK